ncbi:MAG TPA: hypothetical protein VMA74_04155 [Dyella sp.]|uniref:hypothetical protein n=1 Tax=Dyella sp. TaxID=1869338 RepID=UPI002C12F486|nr:hypothetical protein [Dyella sp.]HUB88904.1 hypothetical protein [Dyella sp.]
MTTVTALLIAVSAGLGSILYLAIGKPLRGLLQQACPGSEAVLFWTRFTLVMLYLSPLFLSVAFGLPPAELMAKMDPGSVVLRVVTSSLVGVFLAMLGMGLWVSSIVRRTPSPPVSRSGNDNEFWGARKDG